MSASLYETGSSAMDQHLPSGASGGGNCAVMRGGTPVSTDTGSERFVGADEKLTEDAAAAEPYAVIGAE
jgi:hypothetical protein